MVKVKKKRKLSLACQEEEAPVHVPSVTLVKRKKKLKRKVKAEASQANEKCPAGHMLVDWVSSADGACDGCKQKIESGQYVMDCRPCNWYLCDSCSGCSKNKEALQSAEVAQLVKDLAAEAEDMGETWATEEASSITSKRSTRSPPSLAAVRNFLEEEAEIEESSEEELRPAKKKKKKQRKDADGSAGVPASTPSARRATEAPSGSMRDKPRDELKVYLGNLPWSADEAALRSDFGKFGEITKIHLPLNEYGKPSGTGYIHYQTKETVEKVLLLDDIEYKGRNIKVRRRSPRRRSGRRQAHLRHQEEW